MPSAIDVVRWLGAVQSQDYSGAMWGLAQRTTETTQAQLDRLFDAGAILRTHVMRPTWHFVLPDDIGWLVDLTGSRVRRGQAGRYRELGIGDDEVSRATDVLCSALAGGRFLTRPELGQALQAAGIPPDGQRLPHFLMAAELDGAIVSGPRRGKQFTYALLAERAPQARTLDPSAALAALTRRYFRSHGPAQLQDFVWWSGLTVSDARSGLALAAGDLDRCVVADKEYWFDADAVSPEATSPLAHLLPNWDEYTVGYRDREAVLALERPFDPSLFAFGSVLSNVVTLLSTLVAMLILSWQLTALSLAFRALAMDRPVHPSRCRSHARSRRHSRQSRGERSAIVSTTTGVADPWHGVHMLTPASVGR